MTPSLPGDPDSGSDSGWNDRHDKPKWPSPKLDHYRDVANLGDKTQTVSDVPCTLAMARQEEVKRLAREARNPRHSAVQVP